MEDSALYLARVELTQAALRLVQSRLSGETHPEDPHLDADIEYSEDRVDAAALKLASLLDG